MESLSVMTKTPRMNRVIDEPGAEDRFLRGIRRAVKTPPKPFTKKAKGKGRASDHKSKES